MCFYSDGHKVLVVLHTIIIRRQFSVLIKFCFYSCEHESSRMTNSVFISLKVGWGMLGSDWGLKWGPERVVIMGVFLVNKSESGKVAGGWGAEGGLCLCICFDLSGVCLCLCMLV